jgi:hypothetical protein
MHLAGSQWHDALLRCRGAIDRGALPNALYWDAEEPHNCVRLQPEKRGANLYSFHDQRTSPTVWRQVRKAPMAEVVLVSISM